MLEGGWRWRRKKERKRINHLILVLIIRKYQFMEANNKRRIGGLKDKIPDIQKTLETVRFLQKRDVSVFVVVVCGAVICSSSMRGERKQEEEETRNNKKEEKRNTHAHFTDTTTHHHLPGRLRTPRSNIRTQRHPLRQSPHSSHPRSLFMAWRKSFSIITVSFLLLLLLFFFFTPTR